LSESRLIVGLGNPGGDYEFTRHNLGFLTVRRLADKLRAKFVLSKTTKGAIAKGMLESQEVLLLMPMTFMNHSGVAIHQIMIQEALSSEDLLVICDDFNLGFGQIRLRPKGSDGGHNGLNSVIQQLGTEEFARLRMGIGYPPVPPNAVDYVLEEFTKKEKDYLEGFIEEAVSCCFQWLRAGISAAMDQHNRRKTNGSNETLM
jgi:PTH1 family peptidyl-tRNA hydrolase